MMTFLSEIWRWFRALLSRGPEWSNTGPKQLPVATVDNLLERLDVAQAPDPWYLGWWAHADKKPAHPGRVGGPITPRAVVVHTTDTVGGYAGMVKRITTQRGDGGGCHFMIDRDGHCTQFVPITRNGNHAGGKTHGWWRTGGRDVHPNLWAVGIELVGAGALKRAADGSHYHKDSGRTIPLAEIHFDQKGRAWQKITQPQLDRLRQLTDALRGVIKEMPADAVVKPNGEYVANGVHYFARCTQPDPWLVGHVTLDPNNKTDPGPQVMAWLMENYPV